MFETVQHLLHRIADLGATRFYLKKLSPNDNAKNQVYLGGSFSVLNLLPHGPITSDPTQTANSKRERAKAGLNFYWLNAEQCEAAPNTQLVLYPKYPEVRMSGFITGARTAPKDVMTVRDEGRLLFLGIRPQGQVLGFACHATHPLAQEIHARNPDPTHGVLVELHQHGHTNTRSQLLEALTHIHQQGWIPSQKLNAQGQAQPYSARNGGGYTLEAQLGIQPNGHAEPDYLGWEIKQFGVHNFEHNAPKSPITLFTPEPTEGLYKEQGIPEFMRQFGYPDKSGKAHRTNFGGIYKANAPANPNTSLRLHLHGFDAHRKAITDFANGGIELLTPNDDLAAKWTFANLLDHWDRKHAQAAYLPSLFQTTPAAYHYAPQVLLCEETNFTLFLQGIANGHIYYDPAIKIEGLPLETGTIKRRSQFRTKHNDLHHLYKKTEWVPLTIPHNLSPEQKA